MVREQKSPHAQRSGDQRSGGEANLYYYSNVKGVHFGFDLADSESEGKCYWYRIRWYRTRSYRTRSYRMQWDRRKSQWTRPMLGVTARCW